jgi:CheY-like chemotaxis protein
LPLCVDNQVVFSQVEFTCALAKNATLVAITGWGQPEDQRRSREAGFDYHLLKPIKPETLQQLLASILNTVD